MTKSDYDIITLEKWECPDENDARILTQSNVPKPLHGCAPRVYMGQSKWDIERKKCYMKAHYTCEICGADLSDGGYQAHELYDIDYANQTTTFKRTVCLCGACHLLGIHTGRAITLFKQGSQYYPKNKLLDGAEHTFIIINSWNEAHAGEEPLRVYATWLDYLKVDELREPMEKLIKKYNIKFWRTQGKWENKKKFFPNWKLIYNGKEYKTPYKTMEDWEAAMQAKSQDPKDDRHKDNLKSVFSGGVYDDIKKLIENG